MFVVHRGHTAAAQVLGHGQGAVAHDQLQQERNNALAAVPLHVYGETEPDHGQAVLRRVHGRISGVPEHRGGGENPSAAVRGQQEASDRPGVRGDHVAAAEGLAAGHDQVLFRRVHGNGPVAGVHQEGGRAGDGQAEQPEDVQAGQHGGIRPELRGVRHERGGQGPRQPHIVRGLQDRGHRERHVATVPGADTPHARGHRAVHAAVHAPTVRQQHRTVAARRAKLPQHPEPLQHRDRHQRQRRQHRPVERVVVQHVHHDRRGRHRQRQRGPRASPQRGQ